MQDTEKTLIIDVDIVSEAKLKVDRFLQKCLDSQSIGDESQWGLNL
jgi:hypothetical protein